MLDKYITPVIKPVLMPVVMLIDKCGATPNGVSVFGFMLGMLALPLLAFAQYEAALIVIVLNRIIDGVDGALARYQSSSSSAGGFLDICLDFIFYAAVVLGFALASEQNTLAASVLLFVFIGTGSSFLAFAISAEKHQLTKPQFKYKSFYFLNGLTEGTETIAFFVAFCLWPQYFPWLAYAFAVLGGITVFTRVHGGFHTLKEVEG